ncbi:MAG: serine/threonine protein kinase, partial [Thermoanaerobaculia bacterium]|nr:serine/threonine protein kinase [Thermoanaerobaculia bacterium]
MKVCPGCHSCYDDGVRSCRGDSHPTLIPIRPGERLIAEKYRLDRLIGRGGIGAVYEAQHVGLDRAVAVKLLRHDYLEDEQALARFRREARAVARIRHPNVAGIYDSGVLSTGEPYIAMELVAGETLRSLLDRTGALPIAQAARIGRQLAEGIEAAHQSGVIHRDLKPSNVILGSDHTGAPQAKVLDFSIAKLDDVMGTGSEALTTAGGLLGTPHYMSPEQCEESPLDARSDLYALGVLLYEMLGGRPPFDGRNPAAVALKQVKEAPTPLQRIRRDVPEGLAWLVMQALHKKPAFRPGSAGEMALRLAAYERIEPLAAPADADALTQPQAPADSSEPPPLPARSMSPEPVTEPVRLPVADPEPTGMTYWKSFPTEARGGRSRPPRAFPVYAGLSAAVLIAGALAWLVIRAPGRSGPDIERTARQTVRLPSPRQEPLSTAVPAPIPPPAPREA